MLHPDKVDAFVEAGAAAAQAEIDKLAEFRATPSWRDLEAFAKGLLRFMATFDPDAKDPVEEDAAASNVVSITAPGAGVVPAPVDGGASVAQAEAPLPEPAA